MAGLAAAETLARNGCPCVLIAPAERAVPARGETLSPRAELLLARLGWEGLLREDFVVPVAARYSAWGRPGLTRDDGRMHGGLGWHVDRPRLEAAMADRRDARRLRRLPGRVTRVERRPAGWAVHLDSGEAIEAAEVIDCSGRAAVTTPGPQRAANRRDGLVAVYRSFPLGDAEIAAAILVESVAAGWWYSSVIPGGRLFVAYFTDADLMPAGLRHDRRIWAGLVGATDVTRQRLESLDLSLDVPPEGAATACTMTGGEIAENGIVRAGDAAAAFDPLASNGLVTALWSGIHAAEAVLASREGKPEPLAAYRAAFRDGVSSYAAERTAIYGMERRFPQSPFWRRRHRQHPDAA
jgi:2-polyprenyl-6-methoxyphenol hydroxylase-like FAD-dependent oxidoreductase